MSDPHARPLATAVGAGLGGLLFGAGLVISGMTMPSKVQGFLDFAGAWDPSLMFVMGGAIAVHAVAYRISLGRGAPLLGGVFRRPALTKIDLRLLAGSALFGVGWGLGGLCPGPAVVTLAGGTASALLFVGVMIASSWLTGRLLDARRARNSLESTSP